MIVHNAWYCAGWSFELGERPVGRKLLGHDVVLYRDTGGTARALGARCPHRGSNLAKGTVVDGAIQCPFHGWRFDAAGTCVRIPSQPEGAKISALACVPSFRLREEQGILWLWMGGAEPASDPPWYAFWAPRRGVRRLHFAPQLIDAPFLTVVENQLDRAHLPFIHPGTFGTDVDPLVARHRITVDPDGRGLRVEVDPASPWKPETTLPGGGLRWLARLLGLTTPAASHARFDLGGVTYAYTEYPDGTYDVFLASLTPADAQRTWLFFETVRTRAPHAVGDWLQRWFMRRVVEEGTLETTVVLEAPSRPVSVESDRAGLAVRKLYDGWLRSEAGCPGLTESEAPIHPAAKPSRA